MDSKKIFELKEIDTKLTIRDKILSWLFKDYTNKIYAKGIKKGFDWQD